VATAISKETDATRTGTDQRQLPPPRQILGSIRVTGSPELESSPNVYSDWVRESHEWVFAFELASNVLVDHTTPRPLWHSEACRAHPVVPPQKRRLHLRLGAVLQDWSHRVPPCVGSAPPLSILYPPRVGFQSLGQGIHLNDTISELDPAAENLLL